MFLNLGEIFSFYLNSGTISNLFQTMGEILHFLHYEISMFSPFVHIDLWTATYDSVFIQLLKEKEVGEGEIL